MRFFLCREIRKSLDFPGWELLFVDFFGNIARKRFQGDFNQPMHIFSRKKLKDFWSKYSDSEEPLKAWFHDVKNSEWDSWTDIKEKYPTVSPVGGDRYVFNIKGGNYRLIAKIQFISKLVFVRRIVTHKEYDKIKNIDEV